MMSSNRLKNGTHTERYCGQNGSAMTLNQKGNGHAEVTNGFSCRDNAEKKTGSQKSMTSLTPSPIWGIPRPSVGLVDSVPILFREPYVNSGFRQQGFPWYYYFPNSLLQFHNESMNAWTHVLALLLMLRKLVVFSSTLDYLSDPYTWPLVAGLLCGILLYMCSSVAHSLQSHSELTHYTAFMFDYAGIGLYGLGAVIVHVFYSSAPWLYEALGTTLLVLGVVLAWAICYCCTISKIYYERPYPFARKIWQMTPVAGIYIVLISPIAQRVYACAVRGEECGAAIDLHLQQMAFFALSGFFFASDIPQRFFAGRCDIFMHSHQLFHIAIMLCTLYQMDAVYADFQAREDLVRMRTQPTFFTAFGPVVIVVTFELLTILYFHIKAKQLLAQKKGKKEP